ncbi:AMP-binding protein, partial [Acinetobacter baumannii]
QPAERAALILKNATLGAIVTDRPLGAGLDGAAVTIDSRAEPSAEGAPAGVPRAAFSPDDRACVIYPSGSTGEPKGVALAHTASRY